MVKYIKQNFADSRIYVNLENWNERALAWLERTGNHRVHESTKKRPEEVFALEKQYLIPIFPLPSFESTHIASISRNIRKDNTVLYRSNRYSVPLGSYGKWTGNEVSLTVEKETLIIRHPLTGVALVQHPICLEKGKLIQLNHHKRDRSEKIAKLKETILSQVSHDASVSAFMEHICERYPRYRRDQLLILKEALQVESVIWQEALRLCLKEKLFSANDFRDVVHHLSHHPLRDDSSIQTTRHQTETFGVPTRSLSVYTKLLEGSS